MTVQALEALRGSRTSGFSKIIGSVSDFDLGLFCEFGDLRSRTEVFLNQGVTGWNCQYSLVVVKGGNNSLVYEIVYICVQILVCHGM